MVKLTIGPESEYVVGEGRIVANYLDATEIEINVPGITHLECIGNKLTELPRGINLSIITHLDCENNKIKHFPQIPTLNNLVYLNCSKNHLTEFPNIYDSTLESFICFGNQLKTLPSLPISVKILVCNNNEIDELNYSVNISSLEYFDCANNNIRKLPSNITSVEALNISNNPLTNLCEVLVDGITTFNNQYILDHTHPYDNGSDVWDYDDDDDEPDFNRYNIVSQCKLITISIDQLPLLYTKCHNNNKNFDDFMKMMHGNTHIHIVDTNNIEKLNNIDECKDIYKDLCEQYNKSKKKLIFLKAPHFLDIFKTQNSLKATSKRIQKDGLYRLYDDINKKKRPNLDEYITRMIEEYANVNKVSKKGGKKSRKRVNQKKKNTKKNRK